MTSPERAKCAVEHYTREEVRELIVKAILAHMLAYKGTALDEADPEWVEQWIDDAEQIADRLLAERP